MAMDVTRMIKIKVLTCKLFYVADNGLYTIRAVLLMISVNSRAHSNDWLVGYGSFVVVESKSGTQAGFAIRSCKFCVDFDKQKFGGKFSHKIHPSDSPRQNPESPSPNYVCERFDGSSLQVVSVRRSLRGFSVNCRSDEDEAEDSSKNIFSPYSRDTSYIDSSSLNTRNEFYSSMAVGSNPFDSPSSRIHFTSNRRRHSVQLEDQGTPKSRNDGSFDQLSYLVSFSTR